MAQASVGKRMRLTEVSISRSNGGKRLRYERKLAYLETLPSTARFQRGAKMEMEGGWK